MGEIHIASLCYDTVAKQSGEQTAQKLWEKNGGRGKYVSGMVAVGGLNISQAGCITQFTTEPVRR